MPASDAQIITTAYMKGLRAATHTKTNSTTTQPLSDNQVLSRATRMQWTDVARVRRLRLLGKMLQDAPKQLLLLLDNTWHIKDTWTAHVYDDINWLKHLPGNGSARSIPAGMEKQPVTWVGFEDASRFCQHYGRRLPNEWEWAYAAGNGTSQRWPWGNESREECMPPRYTGRDTAPLPDVDAFDGKQCASPFGAQMLVGTVWQWTNSLQDAHTRTAMLKGGSSYWRRQANASTTAVSATRASAIAPPAIRAVAITSAVSLLRVNR